MAGGKNGLRRPPTRPGAGRARQSAHCPAGAVSEPVSPSQYPYRKFIPDRRPRRWKRSRSQTRAFNLCITRQNPAGRGATRRAARNGICRNLIELTMPLKIKDKKDCRWDLVSLGEIMLRL